MKRCLFFIAALLASTPALAVIDVTPDFGGQSTASPDITATVVKGAGDCASDSGCSLTVKTADGKTATVVLSEGDSMPTCKINRQAATDAMAIAAGTSVTIHVDDTFRHHKPAGDFYYLCGDDAAVIPK